jgi:hypothetical protein
MSNTNTGGPAFPRTPIPDHDWGQEGMTLRDYFAAKAMQGLLANPKLANEILKNGGAQSGWIEDSAFAFADAMLKVREA